jgi:hypothetical protein
MSIKVIVKVKFPCTDIEWQSLILVREATKNLPSDQEKINSFWKKAVEDQKNNPTKASKDWYKETSNNEVIEEEGFKPLTEEEKTVLNKEQKDLHEKGECESGSLLTTPQDYSYGNTKQTRYFQVIEMVNKYPGKKSSELAKLLQTAFPMKSYLLWCSIVSQVLRDCSDKIKKVGPTTGGRIFPVKSIDSADTVTPPVTPSANKADLEERESAVDEAESAV